MTLNKEKLEKEVLQFGKEIFAEVQQRSTSLFNVENITGKLLNIAMSDEAMKVAFFRFVDVLPQLEDTRQVIEHVQEYFEPFTKELPELIANVLNGNPDSIPAKLAANAITRQVRFVANRFIVGENPQSALTALRKIRKHKMAFTVDLLGEATLSDKESLDYQQRYLELLDVLGAEVPNWKESKPLFPGHRGEITPVNISVKLSALYSQSYPLNHHQAVSILSERLAQIFERAKAINAFCYVDMEDTALTDIIIESFKAALERSALRDFNQAGIVLQAYLRRTEEDAKKLITWARRSERQIGVRLVKGAYWDTETILAKQHSWAVPVWQKKESSDYNYERLADLLLENYETIIPAFGSHNIRSLCYAIKAAEARNIPTTHFELQTLFGMGENIKKAFVERNFLVREYAPVGELIPGMGYLVRRLLENTSNEGFLNLSFNKSAAAEVLLKTPTLDEADTENAYLKKRDASKFYNASFIDFSIKEEREKMSMALEQLSTGLQKSPLIVHPIVAGVERPGNNSLDSMCPDDATIIATVTLADKTLAEETVQKLHTAFAKWRSTSFLQRADLLERVAHKLESKRIEINAVIVREVAKPWKEADADTAEAIDFLRYYAMLARQMQTPQRLGDYLGENNLYWYEPRGITVVISPWNFPLAIACGMFCASLVCGNTTILKPAEQSSLTAKMLFDCFLEAGMPADVAAFLPGVGEEIGPLLVEHPLVSTIAFTGSKAVGLAITEAAALTKPNAANVKKVITEMGGKNAIVVDQDADLDEAIKGVIYSAFGFQGQKCSACSRVYVVGNTYHNFVERLGLAIRSINIGPAENSASFVAPVIDSVAHARLLKTISEAENSYTLIAKGNNFLPHNETGYFVPPVAFTNVRPNSSLARDEHFGPILIVEQVESFSDGISAALQSEYALTGSVYSRSPKNITYATDAFRVGNLYINRPSTGALVFRQPFGGMRLSGSGFKAGGPDYLKQFVFARAVSENTMRRGFAPQGE